MAGEAVRESESRKEFESADSENEAIADFYARRGQGRGLCRDGG